MILLAYESWMNMATLAAAGSPGPAPSLTEPLVQTGSAAAPAVEALVRLGVMLILVGMVMCLFRVMRGPHLADRVLAVDAMALHVVALVILLASHLRADVFFDAVLVVAIIGFASTVAFGQYIGAQRSEGRQRPSRPPHSAEPGSS